MRGSDCRIFSTNIRDEKNLYILENLTRYFCTPRCRW